MQPLLDLQGVNYAQSGSPILRNVSWRVMPGEHWAVLGPNGSGKSTLLRIACGYLWPTGGQVLRGGERLANLAEMRRRMGWVGEELLTRVPGEQTALQIAASGAVGQLGLRLIGQVDPTPDDYQRAAAMLQQCRCGELADQEFRVLSQGERQQVLVARARMMEPTILVLDEPCAGMDPAAREGFLQWLQAMLEAPATPTVMLVTHHVEEIMPGFDRTVVVQQGSIAAAGPTREVVAAEMLARVYGIGIKQLIESQGRLWPVWGPLHPTQLEFTL